MTDKVEKAIIKYLTNSATKTDFEMLSNWIKNSDNERLFKEYVKTYYAIICSMNDRDYKKVLEQLLRDIRKEKSFIYRLKTNVTYKYVAVAAIIVLSLGFFFKYNVFSNSSVEIIPEIVDTSSAIVPGTDKATLTLEDGSLVVLEKGGDFQTHNAKSNGEEIIYKKGNQKATEIVYNYLTIPRGGQFNIVLSDGTIVWLNSESQLKYPVNFIDGETRKVELVYGEAYFDVSPSTIHNGAKFKVLNNAQEVEVLGTEFNIKAYKDEVNVYTTLVEGKVLVNIEGEKQNLIPSQQSNLNILNGNVAISNVDVKSEISWKDGLFSFNDKPLKDIMKVISRWYDVDVVFENEELKNIKFIGILGKDQNLTKILETIKTLSIIKNYEINDKTVTLN